MKRIEKILLCDRSSDGSQFLWLPDDVTDTAVIYRAWNDKIEQVTIPQYLRDHTGKQYTVRAVGWNAIPTHYRVINDYNVELMTNVELT